MASRRYQGQVDLLGGGEESIATAQCELVVDAMDLGLDEWEGILRNVSPVGAVAVGKHYRIRLPNGSIGEVSVTRAFSGEAGVFQFLGSSEPPEVP